jgi:hypothetical protein
MTVKSHLVEDSVSDVRYLQSHTIVEYKLPCVEVTVAIGIRDLLIYIIVKVSSGDRLSFVQNTSFHFCTLFSLHRLGF